MDNLKFWCWFFAVFLTRVARVLCEKNEPKIQSFAFPEFVLTGERTTVTCSLKSGSAPFTFRWLKNSHDIRETNVRVRDLEIETVLRIESVTLDNSGNYTCIVSNDYGTDSHTTQLNVKVPPRWIATPRDQKAVLGSSLKMACQAEGIPIPNITWIKENGVSKENSSGGSSMQKQYGEGGRRSEPGKAEWSFNKLEKSDEGRYFCQASNGIGAAINASFALDVYDEPKIQPFNFPPFVLAGEKTTVTCSVKSGTGPFTFSWLKDGRQLTDINRSASPDAVSADRGVKIRNLDEETIIKIEDANALSSGNYTCRISNAQGSDSYSALLLVKAAPHWITKPEEQKVHSGRTATLRCRADGNPKPSITWIKETGSAIATVTANSRILLSPEGFELSILDVTKSDEGLYRCEVTNGLGANLSHAASILVAGLEAPSISPFNFPGTVLEGRKTSATCLVESGKAPFSFEWLKNGATIDQEREEHVKAVQPMSEASMLIIDPVTLQSAGNYTCRVTNQAGADQRSSTLTVKAPVSWTAKPSDGETSVGGRVEFSCRARGIPHPNVTWYRIDGLTERQVTASDPTSILITGQGDLTFLRAREEDTAIYECRADNGLGDQLVARVNLKVFVPAKFEERFAVQSVRKGESATLLCDAKGDSPLEILWFKDKKQLDFSESKRYEKFETTSTTGVASEVVIRSVERADGALYSCSAKNQFGTDERNIKVVVIEVPAQPLDVRTQEVWSRSASITWTAPFSGNSPITNYLVQYWRNKEGPHRLMEEVVPVSQNTVVVKDLHPGTSYAVTVTAENEVGQGEPSNTNYFVTGEEEPSSPPTDVWAESKGANAILTKWKPPPREHWNGVLKGYYVGYKVERASQMFSYKTVDSNSNETYQYLITSLVKSSTYIVVVKAYNSAGTGPPSHEIRVKTLDGDLPKSPGMTLVSTSPSSISLRWLHVTTKEKITGYTIHYKKEGSHWHHIPVLSPDLSSYTITGLESETVYWIYLTATNRYGRADPSQQLKVRTEKSSVTQALPFYLDLSIVIPVAASFIAVVVVVIVVFVYIKKSHARRSLEKGWWLQGSALQNGDKPFTYVAPNQRYMDLDKGRPLSFPDPGTPASSLASYATINCRGGGEDPNVDETCRMINDQRQEMKTFNQNPNDRPSSFHRPNSLKKNGTTQQQQAQQQQNETRQ